MHGSNFEIHVIQDRSETPHTENLIVEMRSIGREA